MRINLTSVLVDDQAQALESYNLIQIATHELPG
jgi:hypothetical protein